MSATILLLAHGPALAQVSVPGRATVRVDAVLALRVMPGGGLAVATEDGVYRELTEAVRLDVTANQNWRLTVTSDPGQTVASMDAVGEVEQGLSVRVGSATTYRAASPAPLTLARGEPGRHTLTVDYLWPDGSGREASPGAVLHFTLSPDN
jgi:hypothetical protein